MEKKNSSNRPCKAEFGGIAKINLHVKYKSSLIGCLHTTKV